MKELPFDIVLHILGFLSVSDLARVIPDGDNGWQLGCKKVLLSRVKQQSWQLELYSSITYFAMLCNPSCARANGVKLICKGYDSYAEYLRFETDHDSIISLQTEKPSATATTISLNMYCRYWQRPFSEGDPQGIVSLDWRQGHQTSKTQNLTVDYSCFVACESCSSLLNQCNHQTSIKKIKINRIMVSLDWFRQRLICQYRNIF